MGSRPVPKDDARGRESSIGTNSDMDGRLPSRIARALPRARHARGRTRSPSGNGMPSISSVGTADEKKEHTESTKLPSPSIMLRSSQRSSAQPLSLSQLRTKINSPRSESSAGPNSPHRPPTRACGSGAVSTSKPGVGALGSGQTAGETVVRTVLSPKGRAAHATESTGKIPTRSVQQASSVSTPSCSPDVLLNSSTSLSLPMSGAATPTLHSRFADLRDEMKRRRCNGGPDNVSEVAEAVISDAGATSPSRAKNSGAEFAEHHVGVTGLPSPSSPKRGHKSRVLISQTMSGRVESFKTLDISGASPPPEMLNPAQNRTSPQSTKPNRQSLPHRKSAGHGETKTDSAPTSARHKV